MDNLTFISNSITALSWPIATIVIVTLLRSEVSSLLGRIKKIKHKNSEIDLASEINDIAKSADQVLNKPSSEKTPEQERIGRLAEDSPRGAILDSWLSIETAMGEYALRHGIANDNPHNPPYQRIQNIQLHNLDVSTLGHGIIGMLDRLRRIRNDAVHRTDADITPVIAKEYVALATRVKAKLEEA
tara:strand:- start:903 stop:1460 length:558 start_codon:yes stop_codon:yes gene_type:complete